MKKRLVSIILTVFLVLSMMPFAAFADNAIVCPACGGSVTKQERRLLAAHSDFYKCSKCGKWAYLNAPGGLKLFSVGDQQILDAADANAILNFAFNNGHLIPAEKFTPGGGSTSGGGVGRPKGYADDNGSAMVSPSGEIALNVPCVDIYGEYKSNPNSYVHNNEPGWVPNVTELSNSVDNRDTRYYVFEVNYSFNAPYSGYYRVVADDLNNTYKYGYINYYTSNTSASEIVKSGLVFGRIEDRTTNANTSAIVDGSSSLLSNKGNSLWFITHQGFQSYRGFCHCSDYLTVYCSPVEDVTINKTSITINNNTWNGNIYVDNSNNLTYIYPQYTTVNEKSETVTNISTNPIIYNNETKQYYTYDTVTNNYYYITYETSPTPTPSPSPAPAPTWTPGSGATRGGGVGRHPSDTDAADWTLHYYVLNNRRYDAYYALKKTEVDTDTKLPWVDNKKYISTTQIPIANGQYTVSVPDGVYWRVWSWDEASQTLTGVNSSNWHSTINNFLFNATGEYIFEFCKADGSDFNTAKDVTLKLKNDKITDYEDGGTIVEEPTSSPSPGPTETPSPTEPPIPTATPKPGGGTVPTPGGDSSGGNSGSSDSGWNPFKWLTDLLKDLIEDILKGLWKLLTSIFGFILWLLSLLFKLFPWMPNSGILALCAGVVVVTVIRIIKFITGR